MNRQVYNVLKLTGYKIQEMTNGSFIATRPDGKQSLFDADGNSLMAEVSNIDRLSEVLYSADKVETDQCILFDNKMNIIACEDSYKVSIEDEFIVIQQPDKKTLDIYHRELNVHFKFEGKYAQFLYKATHLLDIAYIEGEYNLICIDYKNRLLRISTSMKIFEIYSDVDNSPKQINNVYITKYLGDVQSGVMEAIDYKGAKVAEAYAIYIDTLNKDSDVLLMYDKTSNTNTTLSIKSDKLDIDHSINLDKLITNIKFTKHPYVLILEILDGYTYFCNIITGEMSKGYSQVVRNIALDDKDNLYVVDLETFESELKLKGVYTIGLYTDMLLVKQNDNKKSFYTLDMQPLIYEF